MSAQSNFPGLVIAFVAGAALAGTAAYLALDDVDGANASHAHEGTTYTCGMHPQVRQDEPGNCPICGMKLTPVKSKGATPAEADDKGPCTEERALYYRAPMDPTYVREGPGKSPMGMDLVPVCDEGEAGVVAVDPEIRQAMGVRTARVAAGPLAHTIRTVARVVPNERREEVVTTKYTGWVEKLFVNETGQFVRRGQALFSIYSPDVVSGQQEYLLAKKRGDTVLQQTAEDRLRFWDLSERQIAAIAELGRPKKAIVVHSPATGYVVMKHVTDGDKVAPGAPLYRIVDLSKIWVQADVYEYELPWLQVDQPASLSLSYVAGRTFEGKVTYIYPTVDERSRTIRVRLEFDNPGLVMRPGMFGSVRIDTKQRDDVLQVPSSAVIRTGTRNLVFVALGEGRFKATEVELGEQGERGAVEILTGLHAGQRVVTSGHFLLDSESQLEEAVAKMRPPEDEASGPASGPASRPSSRPASRPAGER